MGTMQATELNVHDDMTDTEMVEALRTLCKIANRIAGVALARGRKTAILPCMQNLLASAANLEQAANNWDGPSNLAVPQGVSVAPRTM